VAIFHNTAFQRGDGRIVHRKPFKRLLSSPYILHLAEARC